MMTDDEKAKAAEEAKKAEEAKAAEKPKPATKPKAAEKPKPATKPKAVAKSPADRKAALLAEIAEIETSEAEDKKKVEAAALDKETARIAKLAIGFPDLDEKTARIIRAEALGGCRILLSHIGSMSGPVLSKTFIASLRTLEEGLR